MFPTPHRIQDFCTASLLQDDKVCILLLKVILSHAICRIWAQASTIRRSCFHTPWQQAPSLGPLSSPKPTQRSCGINSLAFPRCSHSQDFLARLSNSLDFLVRLCNSLDFLVQLLSSLHFLVPLRSLASPLSRRWQPTLHCSRLSSARCIRLRRRDGCVPDVLAAHSG